MTHEDSTTPDLLADLVAEALRHGADGLDIEYEDGHDEVCAMKSNVGFGIASIRASSDEGQRLRRRLSALKRKR